MEFYEIGPWDVFLGVFFLPMGIAQAAILLVVNPETEHHDLWILDWASSRVWLRCSSVFGGIYHLSCCTRYLISYRLGFLIPAVVLHLHTIMPKEIVFGL